MQTLRKFRLYNVIVCCFVYVTIVNAQSTISNEKISLPNQYYTVSQLFDILINQYNINLSYDSELESIEIRINFPGNEYPLKSVLSEIKKQSGSIDFILKDNNIVAKKIKFTRKVIISGFVRSESDGEALVGATVYDVNTLTGTVANNYGFYSISTNSGNISIRFSFIGYNEKELKCSVTKDTVVDINLSSQNEIKEVVINASKNEKLESTQVSKTKIDLKKAGLLPNLIGESDLMKTIQLIPGVQQGTEGTGGLYIRGGSQGGNLVLLDGAPVYNLNHFGGLFSVFNTEAIQNVDVYKGGFPARYGGRLSSVIDIRMKEGNNQKFSGSGSIGLISSKILFEGPIIKDKTSFIFTARRSNLDLLAKPFVEEGGILRGTYFYDANFKINHRFSSKSRLFLSYYTSKDAVDIFLDKSFFSDAVDTSSRNFINKIRTGLSWDNVTSSMRWNYVLTNKLFLNTTITYSSYGTQQAIEGESTINAIEQTKNFKEISDLENKAASIDFSWYPANKHAVKFGGSYMDNTYPFDQQKKLEKGGELLFDTVYWDTIINTRELHGYIEDNISISPDLQVLIGVHPSFYQVQNKWYKSFEPRIALRYKLSPIWSVKAAYSEMTQYVFQKSNIMEGIYTGTEVSLRFSPEIWLPSTKKLPPQKSKQIVLGTFFNFKDKFEFSMEGFYKNFTNVIEDRGLKVDQIPDIWEDLFQTGKGRSYGLEFLLEKKAGKLSGWIAYTLSKTERQFDSLAGGQYFPYKFDRRHNLNLVANYYFNNRIDVGLIWTYRSGHRLSLPDGQYISNYNFNTSGIDSDKNDLYTMSNINAYQLPAYHRLDLSVNLHKDRKRFSRTWSFGVYNVYNRRNPYLIFLDYRKEKGQIDTGKEVAKSFTLFPLLPYINYSIKF